MSKTETQEHKHNTRKQPELTRRGMIKTVGAAGGVAAVGSGAVPYQKMSPVQNSEAIGVTGGIAIGIAAGAVIGVAGTRAYDYVLGGSDQNVEQIEQSLAEDELHDLASGMNAFREGERKTLTNEWLNQSADETPYANAAFNQAEYRAAIEIVNGNDQDALQAAYNANDQQATRSLYNILQGWNKGLLGGENSSGLLPGLVNAVSHGTGTANVVPRDDPSSSKRIAAVSGPNENSEDWEPIPASETFDPSTGDGTGKYILWEYSPGWDNPPAPFEDVEGVPSEGPKIIGLITKGNGINMFVHPFFNGMGNQAKWSPSWYSGTEPWDDERTGKIVVSHSERPSIEPVQGDLMNKVIGKIGSGYDTLENDLGEYIPKLNDALAEGAMEPHEIIGPRDALEEFAGTGEQSQFAARMVFHGMGSPGSEYTYQAKVSHPDIVSESKWGQLYVSLNTENVEISPGTTLKASDYEAAYFHFPREDRDGYDTRILSGDDPLEILDVTDVTNEETQDAHTQTAKENGKVVLWDEEAQGEAPEYLQFPADHQGWKVIVQGAVNSSKHPLSDVVATEGQYILEQTQIPEGETVENVRYLKPPTLKRRVEYADDPANINNEQIIDRIEQRQELVERIRELENSGGIGGGGGLGGLPTLPGLGVLESAVVVVLGIFGLNALSS